MNKILENYIFKQDLLSIDRFICQYGNLGFLHPKLSVRIIYFDCNEEVEILEEDFDFSNHYHTYFVNYDEILPIFDFGLFYNATATVFSDLSFGFRKKLKEYLLTINDSTIKQLAINEIRHHFIAIDKILSSIENLNTIQQETINFFLAQYRNEISYLEKLYINFSLPFSKDSMTLNDEVLESFIERILDEKTSKLIVKVNSIEGKISEELLSLSDARKFLNIKDTTFWRMRKSGIIPEHMIGTKICFKKSELLNSLVRIN